MNAIICRKRQRKRLEKLILGHYNTLRGLGSADFFCVGWGLGCSGWEFNEINEFREFREISE
jgi:hypothetical protein